MDPVDLETAATELYTGDLDSFVARRTELVRAARSAGNRPLAAAIAQLRKPTRPAWLVNLYARSSPGELTALLELGAALRTAQEQLSAAELRRLSAERSTVVAAACRHAVSLGEERGYRASEAVRQEVSQTLQAALADPAVAEHVRAGTLTEAHNYGGFGPLAIPPAAPAMSVAPADSRSPRPASDASAEEKATAKAREEQQRAERARAAAEQRLQNAESALNQAADEAEEASERVAELDEQITALRTQLDGLEQAKTQAEQQATDAQRLMAELQDRVRAAREAYDQL